MYFYPSIFKNLKVSVNISCDIAKLIFKFAGFYPTIYCRGSIIMCQVQKHGTEIFEVEVWLHFITILKSDGAKIKTDMYKMDINVQYVERNTSLGVF